MNRVREDGLVHLGAVLADARAVLRGEARAMSRPTVLFYCQHSLGLGHLVRSFALAGALAERFRVVLLNGGRLPRGLPTPPGVEIVSLPPLGMTVDGALVSHDRRRSTDRALQLRRRQMLELQAELRPEVLFVELFPFGRKKFAVGARAAARGRPRGGDA